VQRRGRGGRLPRSGLVPTSTARPQLARAPCRPRRSRSGGLRAHLYDAAIVPLTARYYRAVLRQLPARARLLDVGIGTGAALSASADLIVERDLRVHGIDTNPWYLARCAEHLGRADLLRNVTTELISVYDHSGGPYDAVYFSDSLMVLPEPARAVRHVADQLSGGGRVYFTQTFHDQRVPLLEWLKPRARWLTTIDFGRVTYEQDFRATIVDHAGLNLDALHVLRRSHRSSQRLAIARPSSVDGG
jgi:SAM-dependent methyltransferase